jgi:DNA-binding SARP family transcriptional activator
MTVRISLCAAGKPAINKHTQSGVNKINVCFRPRQDSKVQRGRSVFDRGCVLGYAETACTHAEGTKTMSNPTPTRLLDTRRKAALVGGSSEKCLPLRTCPPAPALRRERLLERLRTPARLTLVLAPAGCGKTTLLSQYSNEASGSIVWHRTDRLDAEPAHFTAKLARGMVSGGVLSERPEVGTAQDSFDRFVDTVTAVGPEPFTFVLDDAHLLIGSPTENCIEMLLCHLPGISVVLASRRPPQLNLCRMEITPITVVTADDLRFRSWEVELLFRDVYREPLPPDDIAALTRRTEGWAACLQLFHLSTQSRPLGERRRALHAMAGGPQFVRTYLARTVLEELPQRLRSFLTRTCVFELLTAQRCDRLLDTVDAQHVLEELQGLGALTTSTDGGQTFRYHEVLRRHLEGALLGELGAKHTQLWYAKTAALLEEAGALGEAIRAHLRAECWTEATRLLRKGGARVIAAEPNAVWLDLLPQQIVDEDPWLSMAVARRLAAEGRLREAVRRYHHAETLFPDPADRQRAAWDRRLVELWTDGRAQPQLHWLDRLRAAVHRHPGSVAVEQTQGDRLCAAIASLLTGNVREAGRTARKLLDDPNLDDPNTDHALALTARLVQAAVNLISGEAEDEPAERLATDAERSGALWLARQARVICAHRAGDAEEIQRIATECEAVGDVWGRLLAQAAYALCQLLAEQPAQSAWREVAVRCRALGAGSVEAWSLTFAALAAAQQGEPGAASAARFAESFSRTAGVWGAQALTALVLAATEPGASAAQLRQARSLADMHGMPWPEKLAARLLVPTPPADKPVTTSAAPPAVRVRCLGGFAFEVLGRSLNWNAVRPRAAAMLRLLAIHTPQPVHRELLLQLWPDLSTDRAVRSMQVAVSSLRALLAPGALGESFGTVERHGDTYVLVLPPGSDSDVGEFTVQLQAATQARHVRDADAERAALARAVAAYRGELLPEDGPAEWVNDARERLRQQAATAAGRLAELESVDGHYRSAIDAARRSVDIDPFRDASWRTLIDAYRMAGEPAAAARAEQDYTDMLSTLGIPATPPQPLASAPVR